jgi:hypothetical protein
MNALVEEARTSPLTPKNQHRVLTSFAKSWHAKSEALPDYGRLARALIDNVGELLEDRVHGKSMVGSGCGFSVAPELLSVALVGEAIRLAIAYSHMCADEDTIMAGELRPESAFRLSFVYGVHFWLPLRIGPSVVLRPKNQFLQLPEFGIARPATSSEAKGVMRHLGLDIQDAH